MIYLSVVPSALLLIVANVMVLRRGKAGLGAAGSFSAVVLLVTFFMTLLVPALNALLVAIAAAACWLVGARPRWFLVSSVGATIAAYALVSWSFVEGEMREWERLKEAHPGESLAARLSYEGRPRPAAPPPVFDSARLSLVETNIQNVVEQARRQDLHRSWRRDLALTRLHAGVVQQFIDSPGFGPIRMPAVRPRDVEWEDPEPRPPEERWSPIPQPRPAYTPADPGSEIVTAAAPEFAESHGDNTIAFLRPWAFGVGHDRAHVFDFKPHGFLEGARAPARWHVARLDLIGLLKYDQPRAYVSDHLPTMEELREAETRSLDGFEARAVSALLRGEDVVVQEAGDRTSMLGSIRAVKQCVRCHQVKRGELLGALSYKLIPK
jgi:hypothetical protein